MALSIPQKRLYIHRQYFALSASDAVYAQSRRISLEAAYSIFNECQAADFPFDDKLDTLNHVLPAAIVLMLDCLYPCAGDEVCDSSQLTQRSLQVGLLLQLLRNSVHHNSSTTSVLIKTMDQVESLYKSTIAVMNGHATSPEIEKSLLKSLHDFQYPDTPLATSWDNQDGLQGWLDTLGFGGLRARLSTSGKPCKIAIRFC